MVSEPSDIEVLESGTHLDSEVKMASSFKAFKDALK